MTTPPTHQEPGHRPAFPVVTLDRNNPHSRLEPTLISTGLTVRQYYKAAALQGIIADPSWPGDATKLAKLCGQLADALLAEDSARAQQQGGKDL